MFYSDQNCDLEPENKIDDYTDEGIRQHVCQALRESHIPGEENVEVYVTDGIVVLEGDIEDGSIRKIEALVKGLTHVQGLVSKLQPERLL